MLTYPEKVSFRDLGSLFQKEKRNMKAKIVRFCIAWLLVLSALGVAVLPAQAAKPVVDEGVLIFTSPMTGICAFEVQVDTVLQYSDKYFYDQDGVLLRQSRHMNEVDTYHANGKTLVGIPYSFNIEATFDAQGNLLHGYNTGVVAKVRLPDGSLFISAGWFDWARHPAGTTFVISPERGNPGNLAGFCAALAP
jgi:hypothetical protein